MRCEVQDIFGAANMENELETAKELLVLSGNFYVEFVCLVERVIGRLCGENRGEQNWVRKARSADRSRGLS